MPRDVGVVLVAAGQGTRVGGAVPKQFRLLSGVPVLLWSLRTFLELGEIRQVVVVLPVAETQAPPEWLSALLGDRVALAAGGAERAESVERGTDALVGDCITVLVHDAARPLVDQTTIEAVIALARTGDGAVPALPVGDTLKEAEPDHWRPRILRTVPRERLWQAQTPQGFPRGVLRSAQRQARIDGLQPTDDAALVEHHGGTVRLVPGAAHNFKLTTEADFALAELIIAARASADRLSEG